MDPWSSGGLLTHHSGGSHGDEEGLWRWFPSLAGCREELLDPPDLGSTTAVACSMFHRKVFSLLGFLRRREFIGGRAMWEGGLGSHTTWWHGQGVGRAALWCSRLLAVGTPVYHSGIPGMHTIHDPMISVSWIHISELITELHHPLQYQNKVLQLVTWPRLIMPRMASLQLSSGYQAVLMTHVMPTTLQAIWLGDIPSSHQHRHTHHRLQLKSSSRSDQVNSQG
jgi:hypothetical protein